MRVIAGTLKGRKIPFNNRRFGNARVTGDFVKEAVFASLGGDLSARSFLDPFAGSGQMGFEAYSRGARVLLGDRDRRRCDFIRDVAREWGIDDGFEVRCVAAARLLEVLEAETRAFDVVYLDPPYDAEEAGRPLSVALLDRLGGSSLLAAEATVAVQHDRGVAHPEAAGRLQVVREKRYGDSFVTTYRAKPAAT